MPYSISAKGTVASPLKSAQAAAMQSVKNQDLRFKIIAENMANADSTSLEPGGDPYRRQEVVFEYKRDKAGGEKSVQAKNIVYDKSEFRKELDPSHPAADEQGYVKKPNVDPLLETVDMMRTKTAQRAMLKIYNEATSMRRLEIDLMR